MHKIGNPLYYAAVATTAIAGILHFVLISPPTNPYALGTNILVETFFIVTGIVQIFWALPMVKRWGNIWYYIGIAGAAILIILWALTRAPNAITGGRALPIDEIGISIVAFQIAYVMITVIIIVKERNGRVKSQELRSQ